MVYELVIDNEETDEIMRISLVSSPAIEENWVYMNEDKVVKFATLDEDKKLIVAPVLIPDKQIIRADGEGLPYWVFFRAETIEKLAQNFLQKGYQLKANIEHEKDIEGKVAVVESWVSKSSTKDKSNMYFNKPFPAGTWFITWKVLDDDIWNDYIKSGELKGASIEGLFEHKLVSASKEEVSYLTKEIDDLTEEEAKALLNHIHSLLMPSMNMNDLEDACWEGYVAIGTKMKDGREVPNCVPLAEALEYISITSTYPGQAATGSITESTI